jgi:hypothetical protein
MFDVSQNPSRAKKALVLSSAPAQQTRPQAQCGWLVVGLRARFRASTPQIAESWSFEIGQSTTSFAPAMASVPGIRAERGLIFVNGPGGDLAIPSRRRAQIYVDSGVHF